MLTSSPPWGRSVGLTSLTSSRWTPLRRPRTGALHPPLKTPSRWRTPPRFHSCHHLVARVCVARGTHRMAGSWSGSGRYRAPDAHDAREPTDHSQVHPARGAHLSVFNQSMVMTNQEFDADCRHCGGRLVLADADRRSAVRTAWPTTSRRGELSPHQNLTCAAAMPRPLLPSCAANKALERPARMLPASHAPLHPTPTRIASTCGPLRP